MSGWQDRPCDPNALVCKRDHDHEEENVVFQCSTIGCPGDARYAAPGRGHVPGCHYPSPVTVVSTTPRDPDTLPEWLFYRFQARGHVGDDGAAWERLRAETYDPSTGASDQDHWAHEAEAVRRAVARGGFKVAGRRAGKSESRGGSGDFPMPNRSAVSESAPAVADGRTDMEREADVQAALARESLTQEG